MVKLRYAGMRLIDDPSPVPIAQTLNRVIVGGTPLSFKEQTLHMAGSDYTPEGWLELRRRIDRMYIQAGLLEEVGPPKAPWEGKSSSFLTHNTTAILQHDQGRFKRPPWWLRWLYSAVVTKEQYG